MHAHSSPEKKDCSSTEIFYIDALWAAVKQKTSFLCNVQQIASFNAVQIIYCGFAGFFFSLQLLLQAGIACCSIRIEAQYLGAR